MEGGRGGHNPPGRAWAPKHTQVGCGPLGAPSGTSLAQLLFSGPEKISQKFRFVWTLFGIDFLQSKKQAKKQQLALGTMSIG